MPSFLPDINTFQNRISAIKNEENANNTELHTPAGEEETTEDGPVQTENQKKGHTENDTAKESETNNENTFSSSSTKILSPRKLKSSKENILTSTSTNNIAQSLSTSLSKEHHASSSGLRMLYSAKVASSSASFQKTFPGSGLLQTASSTYQEPFIINSDIRKSIFRAATQERADHRFAWKTNFDFALVSLACANGPTNLVRFPEMCKKYGAMGFCVPYVFVVFFLGIPLHFLETLLGQYSGHGTIAIMNELVPAFVGIGYALVINNFVSFMRGEMQIARLMYFTISTMKPVIPWAVCQEQNSIGCYTVPDNNYCKKKFAGAAVFFNRTCMHISTICTNMGAQISSVPGECLLNNGSSLGFEKLIERITPEQEFLYREILNLDGADIENIGPIEWPMLFCLGIAWAGTYLLGYNGFATVARSAYFTAFAPLFGHSIVLFKALSLDGAREGLKAYLSFDVSSLERADVWVDAIKTCFNSLSLGLGLLPAISSANKPYKNCLKTTLTIICFDTFLSLVSGLGVFALLGHMAHLQQTTVQEFLKEKSNVIYTLLPTSLATLEFPRVYVVIAFFSTVIASLGYLAAVIAMAAYDGKDIFNSITNHIGKAEQSVSKLPLAQVNLILCILGFTFSILFVAKGGTLVLEVTDISRHVDMSYIIAALQTIVICVFYGSGNLLNVAETELRIKLGCTRPYWALCWNLVAPVLMFWKAFSVEFNTVSSNIPEGWNLFSIAFAFYPLLIVIGFFIFKICNRGDKSCLSTMRPTKRWCLGLDSLLLVDVERTHPEMWGKRLVFESLPQTSSVYSQAKSLSENVRSDASQYPQPSPVSITETAVNMRVANSENEGHAVKALLSHVVKSSYHVPFGRQIEEGDKEKRKVSIPAQIRHPRSKIEASYI